MKAVRTRWRLYAGCMLLTWDAHFMVTVEPGCVVIWRLKDNDDVAYRHYTDNQRPADDLQYDDQDFCYVYDDSDVSGKPVPELRSLMCKQKCDDSSCCPSVKAYEYNSASLYV